VRNRASAPNHASYAEVASLRPVIEDYSKTLLGLFAAGEYNYISHLAHCQEPAKYESVNWVAKTARVGCWPPELAPDVLDAVIRWATTIKHRYDYAK